MSRPRPGTPRAGAGNGPLSGDRDLSTADLIIQGTSDSSWLGGSAQGTDLDADGWSDLLFAAMKQADYTGIAFVVYGPALGVTDASLADARFVGNPGDMSGLIATSDLDGDALPEIVMGSPYNDDTFDDAGAIWVIPDP